MGRQSQARHYPRIKKAHALLRNSPRGNLGRELARPCTKPFAKAGGGRREQEADSEAREEQSSRAPVATVEGIRSSESRRPSRGGGGTRALVGPAHRSEVSSSGCSMHRRQRVSRDRREGERRQRAETKPHALATRINASLAVLRGHVLCSVHGPVQRPPVKRERSDRYRGRENPSNRKEPAPGSVRADGMRGSPLVIALARERHGGSEKEDGLRRRPCEETRVVDAVPVRRMQLQKSTGGTGSRIGPREALQKE